MTNETVFEMTLPNGQNFKGTLSAYLALKSASPEMFVAPTTVENGNGSSKPTFTEAEKEKWNKGRIFGLMWSVIIAQDKLNSARNGKEDLSMLDKKEAKKILNAVTQDKLKAMCKEFGYDYNEYLACYKYKKECDDKKKK